MKKGMGGCPRKIRFTAVFAALVLLLGGCGDTTMKGYADFYGRDNLTSDGDYIYYKDVVTVEEAYPSFPLKELKINIPEGVMLVVAAVDFNGTIYMSALDATNNLDMSLSSIGYYDKQKEKYIPFIQSDGSFQASFCSYVADRYILWSKMTKEGASSTGLFLYDLHTEENTQICAFEVDANTGLYSGQPSLTDIVTIGKDIYFSVVGYQNGAIATTIYRYDTDKRTLEAVSEENGTLFSYQGGVACLTEGKKDEQSGTYSRQIKDLSGEVLEEIDNSEYGSIVGGGDILVQSGYFSLSQAIALRKKCGIETALDERELRESTHDSMSSDCGYLEILWGGGVHPLIATQGEST